MNYSHTSPILIYPKHLPRSMRSLPTTCPQRSRLQGGRVALAQARPPAKQSEADERVGRAYLTGGLEPKMGKGVWWYPKWSPPSRSDLVSSISSPPASPVRLALPIRHRLRVRRLPGWLGRRAGVAKHCGQVEIENANQKDPINPV